MPEDSEYILIIPCKIFRVTKRPILVLLCGEISGLYENYDEVKITNSKLAQRFNKSESYIRHLIPELVNLGLITCITTQVSYNKRERKIVPTPLILRDKTKDGKFAGKYLLIPSFVRADFRLKKGSIILFGALFAIQKKQEKIYEDKYDDLASINALSIETTTTELMELTPFSRQTISTYLKDLSEHGYFKEYKTSKANGKGILLEMKSEQELKDMLYKEHVKNSAKTSSSQKEHVKNPAKISSSMLKIAPTHVKKPATSMLKSQHIEQTNNKLLKNGYKKKEQRAKGVTPCTSNLTEKPTPLTEPQKIEFLPSLEDIPPEAAYSFSDINELNELYSKPHQVHNSNSSANSGSGESEDNTNTQNSPLTESVQVWSKLIDEVNQIDTSKPQKEQNLNSTANSGSGEKHKTNTSASIATKKHESKFPVYDSNDQLNFVTQKMYLSRIISGNVKEATVIDENNAKLQEDETLELLKSVLEAHYSLYDFEKIIKKIVADKKKLDIVEVLTDTKNGVYDDLLNKNINKSAG
ncbi:hypothetical protein [Lactobacillus sp. PSON]|uniref:hypothetical protein n=1 Tax=Lactobacillus sp. PSON TaxID=3455454 RepID=UPI004042E862